jgi:hypothetical protein
MYDMAGFLGQRKSVKQPRFHELDNLLFKQCSDQCWEKKALNIGTGFGIKDFTVSDGRIHSSYQLRDDMYKLV